MNHGDESSAPHLACELGVLSAALCVDSMTWVYGVWGMGERVWRDGDERCGGSRVTLRGKRREAWEITRCDGRPGAVRVCKDRDFHDLRTSSKKSKRMRRHARSLWGGRKESAGECGQGLKASSLYYIGAWTTDAPVLCVESEELIMDAAMGVEMKISLTHKRWRCSFARGAP